MSEITEKDIDTLRELTDAYGIVCAILLDDMDLAGYCKHVHFNGKTYWVECVEQEDNEEKEDE